MASKRSSTRSRSKSKKNPFLNKIKELVLSSQGLPIVLSFCVLGVLFVLFRMKGVELDYKVSEINSDIKKVTIEQKELKAQKARLLSVKKLKRLAKKYDLNQPDQKQIIVIP